jgi:hypothetical protein
MHVHMQALAILRSTVGIFRPYKRTEFLSGDARTATNDFKQALLDRRQQQIAGQLRLTTSRTALDVHGMKGFHDFNSMAVS